MTDRKKVIKGLECLITNEVPCEGCPYYGSGPCLRNIGKDAMELLKDNGARVLTLDEAEEADICWFEVRGVNRIVPCRISFYDAETVIVYRLIAYDEEFSTEDYGKHCRLWSAKPDDKQREAVKWDD